jgi:murein DD-endopeptidase MepM/ murein hydrolase activator NlpD
MIRTIPLIRSLTVTTALVVLSACAPSEFDWDLRKGATLDTTDAAQQATTNRPMPDAKGVISYPGYQVAVAQRGDTVETVAGRLALPAAELATYNALRTTDPLRPGEVLALPRRVASAPGTGAIIGAPVSTGAISSGAIDVTSLATGAIDRAAPAASATPAPAAVSGPEPGRHKVARGETAFTIARTYNVSPKALAEWNGLGADMNVREGQILLIPVVVASQSAPPVSDNTVPGQGTPTPVPPSASQPLPDEKVEPASTAKPAGTPDSPDLVEERTGATAAKFSLPVDGKVIRTYAPPKSLGMDFSSAPGANVRAAADGTVAAITKDTDGTAIVILRHADNLLTVYGGVDNVTIAKGAAVSRGSTFAKVRASDSPFLHFEVRQGFDAVDPGPYLN